MEILYMGTAAAEGWPALFCDCPVCSHAREAGGKNIRSRSQALLDGEVLIDFPPDSYAHAVKYGLNFGKIHTLLITHSHMDHWFPTDLIHRHSHFGHGAEGVLHVYGNAAVEKAYYDHILIDRFRAHPLDGVVQFHRISGGDRFAAGGWEIVAVPADHDQREECLVYICKKDGKALFYGHDTGVNLPDTAWELLSREHFDLVSLDATRGRNQKNGYHMGLPDIEPFVEKLTVLGCVDSRTQVVLNHFSHNGQMTQEELTAWAGARGMTAAWDGLTVTI